MSRRVETLRLGLEDLVEAAYRQVPFEVGPDAPSIEVHLAYDTGEAVIDLGCDAPAGWRGWSGGARDRFVIGPDRATPGYLPGDLEPGEWRVVLGLHRLPPRPIEVTVTVSVPATSTPPPDPLAPPGPHPRAPRRGLPAPPGMTWFAGDLHAHTTHSDGALSIDQLAAGAAARGLDFLAVTDHNTVSHHAHLPAAGARHHIALLPGQELTTGRGHANAYGDLGFVDFRRPADQWVSDVAARNGILSINHALDRDMAWQHRLRTPPRALEIWHWTWFHDLHSTAPWTLWSRWPAGTALVGGSDFHRPADGFPVGTPTTWVAAAERSPEALLAAVADGRTAITRGPEPDLPALLRAEDDLWAIDADGTQLCDVDGRRRIVHGARVRIPASQAGAAPYRLETPDGELLAISP